MVLRLFGYAVSDIDEALSKATGEQAYTAEKNVQVSAIQVDILWVLQDTSVEQFSFRFFGSKLTTK